VRPNELDELPQAGIVGANRVSRGSDLADGLDTFDLGRGRNRRVGEPLEPSGGLLNSQHAGGGTRTPKGLWPTGS
jgi:hypothetical protein